MGLIDDVVSGKLPTPKEARSLSISELEEALAKVGDPDWTVEHKVITRQMGVSDAGKLRLLMISVRTGLSPTRALDAAIRLLEERSREVNIPTQDQIVSQLVQSNGNGSSHRRSTVSTD